MRKFLKSAGSIVEAVLGIAIASVLIGFLYGGIIKFMGATSDTVLMHICYGAVIAFIVIGLLAAFAKRGPSRRHSAE